MILSRSTSSAGAILAQTSNVGVRNSGSIKLPPAGEGRLFLTAHSGRPRVFCVLLSRAGRPLDRCFIACARLNISWRDLTRRRRRRHRYLPGMIENYAHCGSLNNRPASPVRQRPVKRDQGSFTGSTPSNVSFTGLMKPRASNSMRSMHVTRWLPSVSPSGRR